MDLNTEVFKQLLLPSFDFKNFDMETMSTLAMEAQETKSIHQRVIGRLAMAVQVKYGEGSLKEFANQADVPLSTVYAFKNVEERLDGIKIPDDISWTVRRLISLTSNPRKFIKQAIAEGWSAAQIRREIIKSKDIKEKIFNCPSCGAVYLESVVRKELKNAS